jgi:hypothetical protein
LLGMPPHLSAKEIEPAMLAVLEPFTQYITYLAKGKLDGYFNSIRPEGLVTDLEVQLPMRPMLLHNLSKYTNRETIEHLFAGGTVFVVFLVSSSWWITNAYFAWCSHLFAVSGSGKTCCTLKGLCHNWGFYISCRVGSDVSQKQTTEWTIEDWKRVIWSDGRKYVWRDSDEGLSDRLVEGAVRFCGGNLMLWGCMKWDGIGYATRIEGKVNADLYVSILEDELLQTVEFYGKTADDIIFQQDNDPKHTRKKEKK